MFHHNGKFWAKGKKRKKNMKSILCLDCVWVDNSLPSHTSYPPIRHAAHEHSSSLHLPIIYSLNHCKYIQKKKLWDKAGTWKEMHLPQQSCGSVTSSWTPSRELKLLKFRPGAAVTAAAASGGQGDTFAHKMCVLLYGHGLGASPLCPSTPQ